MFYVSSLHPESDQSLMSFFRIPVPPKIVRVTPQSGATVGVHNATTLSCFAEGNPAPKFQWLQRLPTQQVLKRGFESQLVIEDTNYDHQGDYVCEAINVIGGKRKIVQSEPIHIEVKGERHSLFVVLVKWYIALLRKSWKDLSKRMMSRLFRDSKTR